MEDRRYCINCKFAVVPPNTSRQFARCDAPEAAKDGAQYVAPDLHMASLPYASQMRKHGGCGPEAKWFEPEAEG